MSRIDKAIEMAARKLNSKSAATDHSEVGLRSTPESTLALAGYSQIDPAKVDNPLLVPLTDPNGFAAEQYKKLRSLILRITNLDRFENSLLVTSATAGEGKSLTAMNLAISIAKMTDYSVVFVDIDLRNPQLHLMLDINPGYGLVHYLRDGIPIEKIIHKVGLGNLSLIPAGETLDDPLNLLTSKRMKILINELKERYPDRYVLLDAPPTLPFADMSVLGELVDNILFVCRSGHSSIGQIEQGLEALNDYKVMGIVCNDIDVTMRMDYSHYYGLH